MQIGHTNDVKFRVNVMGTSAEATARVILCTNPQLSFPAEKVGDEWSAHVRIPESIEPGSYDMKVEVMVGNRHFTPLTKSIELVGLPSSPATEPDDSPAEDAVKHEEPVAVEEVVAAEEQAPAVKTISLIKSFVNGQDEVVEAVAKPAEEAPVEQPKKITLPKDFFKFEGKKVDPVKIEFKPLVSMLTHTAIDKPLTKESVRPVLEINHGTPIRLIRGEIIYE